MLVQCSHQAWLAQGLVQYCVLSGNMLWFEASWLSLFEAGAEAQPKHRSLGAPAV